MNMYYKRSELRKTRRKEKTKTPLYSVHNSRSENENLSDDPLCLNGRKKINVHIYFD